MPGLVTLPLKMPTQNLSITNDVNLSWGPLRTKKITLYCDICVLSNCWNLPFPIWSRICWSQAPVCQVGMPSIGQVAATLPCCAEAFLSGGFIVGSKWGGCGLMAIIQSSGVLPGKEGKRRQISCQSTRPRPPHIPSLSLPLPLTTNEWPKRTHRIYAGKFLSILCQRVPMGDANFCW